MSIIKLDSVSLFYEKEKILYDIDLDINKDEIMVIIGPNGCGKTSLIKIIAGIIKPTTGKLYQNDNLVIGYMPQLLELNKFMPVSTKEFLEIMSGNKIDMELCDDIGVSDLLDKYIYNLSCGQLKKVLLLNCLLRKPDLLIMDEPVSGMDIRAEEKFYLLIDKLIKEYKFGVVMVSHDIHMIMRRSDRVICLNGHICCEGKASDIKGNRKFMNIFGGGGIYDHIGVYQHHHDHEH